MIEIGAILLCGSSAVSCAERAPLRTHVRDRAKTFAARAGLTDTLPVRRLLLGIGSSLIAVGCGAAPAPNAPSVPAETSPRTVEEAELAIARARSEIDAFAGSAKTPANQPSAAPTEAPKRPAAPTEPLSVSPSADAACSTPCRALASMRRAVGALCELTGEADTRCTEAKKTLAESSSSVGSCTCP